MRFPTMWHFDKSRFRRACAASFKLKNSKCCHRIFKRQSNALMRRLVWTLLPQLKLCPKAAFGAAQCTSYVQTSLTFHNFDVFRRKSLLGGIEATLLKSSIFDIHDGCQLETIHTTSVPELHVIHVRITRHALTQFLR